MKEIYQVLTGAMGQETRMAQIANNLANVNTTGFKRDGAVFLDELRIRMEDGATGTPIDPAAPEPARTAVAAAGLPRGYIDFSDGPIRQTGRELDVAIAGEGFFMVEGPDGAHRYTRAGAFVLNAEGELTTPDGRQVLDAGGQPIAVQVEAGPVRIAPDGRVMAGEAEQGRLGVARFDEPWRLAKHGEGLLAAPDGMAPEPVAEPALRPGALEGSNVNPIEEMVRMIQTQRIYETQQRLVRTIDELAQRRIEAAQ